MQWRQKMRQTNATEKFDAKRLAVLLLKRRKTKELHGLTEVAQRTLGLS